MKWQTIDSAPRDGTSILVANPDYEPDNMTVASWECNGWLYAHGPMLYFEGATHWMPLPEPPTE